MPSPSSLRVLMLLESARGFDRGLLKGISRYSALHGRWTFYQRPLPYLSHRRSLELEDFRDWRPDGVICPVELTEGLATLNVPMVCTDPGNYSGDLPCIVSEDDKIGELAARHLLESGHQHLAFCGMGKLAWSLNRGAGFCARLEQDGFEVHVLRESAPGTAWSREEKRIRDWIEALPKPVGLFCANDDRAAAVLELCRSLGLNVPDDVSLIGADDDELRCNLANPPFTSVRIATETAGYGAAALLARLAAGEEEPRGGQRIIARAAGIAVRQSTSILMMEHPALRKAVRHIRENIRQPLRVSDVVQSSGLSHRALNELFQNEFHTSIGKYLTRARIEHISTLLLDSSLQIQEVACAAGYEDIAHFSRYFKHSTGLTPNAYRRERLAP